MLTWLAGWHYEGTHPNLWHEDEAAAALALKLQKSPRIREAVDVLSRDADAWTREAAELFLRR